MSQAKVDAYKSKKATRKEDQKKDKTMRVVRTSLVTVLVVALLAWAGVSLYGNIINQQKSQAVTVDYTDVMNYMQTLDSQSAE